MTKVIVGMDNANLESDMRSLLSELEDVEVVASATSTIELVDFCTRFDPDVVMLHEALGPDTVAHVVREIATVTPAASVLQVSPERSQATIIRAMEAGARGVVNYPFAFEDVSTKLASAIEWSAHLRTVLQGRASAARGRGRVIAVAGAKGGVGTTTIVCHLAIDALRENSAHRVCILELDIEKGDIGALLEVRQSVSLADVAQVYQDLSTSTVNDALIAHESGIQMLLAPADVRQSEVITAESIRPIISALRSEFDVVYIDAGGYVAPVQAACLEQADETVVVTTADVLSVRAMRKRFQAWDALGVQQEGAVVVLVNRVDKASTFPFQSISQLTSARVLEATIPESPRLLEVATNERDPRAITEIAWWRLMTKIRNEIDNAGTHGLGLEGKRGRSASTKGRRGRRREPEAGQIAVENVAMIPMAFFLSLIAWQFVVVGISFLYSGHAATVAAREFAIHNSTAQANVEARKALPGPFRDGMVVTRSGSDEISVRVAIPGAGPAGIGFPQHVTSTRSVVMEP